MDPNALGTMLSNRLAPSPKNAVSGAGIRSSAGRAVCSAVVSNNCKSVPDVAGALLSAQSSSVDAGRRPALPSSPVLRRFLGLDAPMTNRNRRGADDDASLEPDLLRTVGIASSASPAGWLSVRMRLDVQVSGVAKPPHCRPWSRHVEHCGRRRSQRWPAAAQVWQSVRQKASELVRLPLGATGEFCWSMLRTCGFPAGLSDYSFFPRGLPRIGAGLDYPIRQSR